MQALPASSPFLIFSFLTAGLLIFTHRKNIERLRAGTESKIYIWKPRQTTPPSSGTPHRKEGSDR